jgi:hypothetical protein
LLSQSPQWSLFDVTWTQVPPHARSGAAHVSASGNPASIARSLFTTLPQPAANAAAIQNHLPIA